MQRRRFLGATSAAALAGTAAGCLGDLGLESTGGRGTPSVPESAPDAKVYYPTHVDGMEMAGMATASPYRFGLTFTWPHRFWTVTGSELSEHAVEDSHSLHLMVTPWHPDSGTVLPDVGLSLEVARDGELVSEEVIYPMLSQPMGFHYGGNFSLPAEGTYTARISVGAMGVRRTGAFADLFDEPASASIEFEHSTATLNGLAYRPLDTAGEPGAVSPMDMMMPESRVPARGALPGRVLGEARTGDGVLVATVVDGADRLPGDGAYLAVSARTPYNRMVLPLMGLSATLDRGGETVFDGRLERTLDPALDYHYGAPVGGVESGDVLTVSVDTPPQVARHLGYERAFLDMPDVEFEA